MNIQPKIKISFSFTEVEKQYRSRREKLALFGNALFVTWIHHGCNTNALKWRVHHTGSRSGWFQAPVETICRPLHTCYTENSLWSSTCPTRAGPPATFSPSRPPGWSGGCAPDFPAGCFFGSSGHWSGARPRNLWIKTPWSQALRM